MSLYEGVTEVLHVSTNASTGCKLCKEAPIGGDKFDESITHLIRDHGYRLLYVGPQTLKDFDGRLWHHIVAVVGK